MSVFATSPEGARVAAVDKIQDKWLRHQDLHTDWIAHDVTGDYTIWESDELESDCSGLRGPCCAFCPQTTADAVPNMFVAQFELTRDV